MKPTALLSSLLPLALLGGAALAGDAEPVEASAPVVPADTLQIRAKVVYPGDGSRIEDGLVLVSGGKITGVGSGADVNAALPVLEHDGVLTAGMVVAHSWFGTGGLNHDETRAMLPTARIAHAFRADHSDFKKACEAGVTTMVLAPTAQNVAGGKTCVVKTNGEILKKEGHLALSFAKEALRQGQRSVFFFFGDVEPAAVDDGFETSGGASNGARYPTSYSGTVAALDEWMGSAAGAETRGELPVLLEAWDRNEVARAAGFAKKHGLKGAVRGAPLAGEVLSVLKNSGLGVILGPFDAGQSQRSLAGLPALAKEGVPLAFSLGRSGSDPAFARMSAAMAVGAGLDAGAAWDALSSDAARIAGVESRVGRLARGLDADLVFWSGNPIDLTSKVEAVFIDGKLVHGGAQ
ncbi:MAG: amidohydrolase family protein [Planctomycetota bacterium]